MNKYYVILSILALAISACQKSLETDEYKIKPGVEFSSSENQSPTPTPTLTDPPEQKLDGVFVYLALGEYNWDEESNTASGYGFTAFKHSEEIIYTFGNSSPPKLSNPYYPPFLSFSLPNNSAGIVSIKLVDSSNNLVKNGQCIGNCGVSLELKSQAASNCGGTLSQSYNTYKFLEKGTYFLVANFNNGQSKRAKIEIGDPCSGWSNVAQFKFENDNRMPASITTHNVYAPHKEQVFAMIGFLLGFFFALLFNLKKRTKS